MIAILGILIGLFVVPEAWTIPVIAGALALEAVETFVSLRIARRFGPARVGPERVIGQRGRVTEACRPRGRVRVRGESWLAHCEAGANRDEEIRVVGREGLVLQVEPLTATPALGTMSDDAPPPLVIEHVAGSVAHIRPIVIGVALRGDRVLAIEGYDSRKNERFYRPPGGGIEFGETSEASLRREFREELDVEVGDVGYVGALESIFTHEGEPGHEIILVYRVTMPEEERLAGEQVAGTESDGVPFTARWLPLADVRDGSAILYPDGLLGLLDSAT